MLKWGLSLWPYEVARTFRKNKPNILLVAVSGWGQEEDRRRSTEAGFDKRLVKPTSLAEIIGVLYRKTRALKPLSPSQRSRYRWV